ncbi:Uncharacterised protein [uncultured archaeon]|nr:Uncharacterised protein [uncultured archaeon]
MIADLTEKYLKELFFEDLDFFNQAIKYEPSPVIPEVKDLPGLKIRDYTREYSIVTERKDKTNFGEPTKPYYITTIWDLEKQIQAHEGKEIDTVFAHAKTDSFKEAMQKHYSSLQHLNNSGY